MKIKSTEIEQWKVLHGTCYSVSNLGRIRNDIRKKIKGQTVSSDGYLTVSLNSKTRQSHRIVAMVWLNDFSENLTVCHLNHDRMDNRKDNLMMATIGDNIRQSSRIGRYSKFGETNNNCKYSTEKILMINTYLNMGFSCKKISEISGICRRYINAIKLGKKRWTLSQTK